MDQVLGTLKNGRIVLDEQPDWPQGQKVLIRLLTDEGEAAPNRNDDLQTVLAEVNDRYGKALKKLAE